MPNEMLTRLEAAALLRIRPHTLANWTTRGRGPARVKLGAGPRAAVRYRLSDVEAWLADPAAAWRRGRAGGGRMTAACSPSRVARIVADAEALLAVIAWRDLPSGARILPLPDGRSPPVWSLVAGNTVLFSFE
jgi:predicted DNA-binding transcriptional regulator AlpA